MAILIIMAVSFAAAYVLGWAITLRVMRSDIRKPSTKESEQRNFDEIMKRLDGFSQLESGWNGYRAEPPGESVNAAREIVARNGPHRMSGWEVFPTGRRSVQMEKTSGDSYTEIEIYSDHVVVYREVKCFLYTESTEVTIPRSDHRKIDRVVRKGTWMPWIY